MTITHLVGDATDPIVKQGHRIIPHICNDAGAFGKGFAESLNKKWKKPRGYYLVWFAGSLKLTLAESDQFRLGQIQVVNVEANQPITDVVNMIAQKGLRSRENPHPICYESLELCLTQVNEYCDQISRPASPVTIHMPRIGSGLAGGDWNRVERIIEATLGKQLVYVYQYCCLSILQRKQRQ